MNKVMAAVLVKVKREECFQVKISRLCKIPKYYTDIPVD